MDWLKEILTKAGVENADDIIASAKAELPKHFITKEKFNEVNEAKKQLEGDIKSRDKELKGFGEELKDHEELKQKFKDLQESSKNSIADYENKIKNIKLDNAIKDGLKDSQAKYVDLLMGKFDREKITIKDDGSIEGLDEQIKSLKEGYGDLFEQPLSGHEPNNTGSSGGIDISKMTYSEMVTYQQNNPGAKLFD